MNKKNFNLLTMFKLRVILCCIIKLYQYNAQIHFDKHCFYKRSIHQLTFTHTHCILPLILFFFFPTSIQFKPEKRTMHHDIRR